MTQESMKYYYARRNDPETGEEYLKGRAEYQKKRREDKREENREYMRWYMRMYRFTQSVKKQLAHMEGQPGYEEEVNRRVEAWKAENSR